jgi:hypothetical protein
MILVHHFSQRSSVIAFERDVKQHRLLLRMRMEQTKNISNGHLENNHIRDSDKNLEADQSVETLTLAQTLTPLCGEFANFLQCNAEFAGILRGGVSLQGWEGLDNTLTEKKLHLIGW